MIGGRGSLAIPGSIVKVCWSEYHGPATSGAGAGMVSVNVIKNETKAYIEDSTVTQVAPPAGILAC